MKCESKEQLIKFLGSHKKDLTKNILTLYQNGDEGIGIENSKILR